MVDSSSTSNVDIGIAPFDKVVKKQISTKPIQCFTTHLCIHRAIFTKILAEPGSGPDKAESARG